MVRDILPAMLTFLFLKTKTSSYTRLPYFIQEELALSVLITTG
jgi:hypothetical protein